MKKTLILLTIVASVAMVGCSKDVKCKCTATTATDDQGRPQVTYVDVDRGFSCRKITRVGFENLLEGNLVRDLQEVNCVEDRN